MERFDVNCYCGQWPFHSTRYSAVDHLISSHCAAGIQGGLITSLQTIFYLDPLTAAAELSKQLPEGYRQIFAVNPNLPAAGSLCRNAYEQYGIAGIRLVPTIHGFDWNGKETQKILQTAENLNLPLFITWNIEDSRLDYLLLQKSVKPDEISSVLRDLPNIPVIITNAYLKNLSPIADAICSRKGIYADTSALNSPLLALDKAYELIGSDHLLYGSGHHIQALSSSVQNMLHCDIPEDKLQDIWWRNATKIFRIEGDR